MDCPKCTKRDGTPSRMILDRSFVGGGSSLIRHSGATHNQFVNNYRCPSCGSFKEVFDNSRVMPFSVEMLSPVLGAPKQGADEEPKPRRVSKYEVTAQRAVMKFRESIAEQLKKGAAFESIAKLLSVVMGEPINAKHLRTQYQSEIDGD